MKTFVMAVALIGSPIGILAHGADALAPKTATKVSPLVNSLGMRFVPVEIIGGPTNGQRILFSAWDTRVQDFAEYARANVITIEKPGFMQGATHPVVNVSWKEANDFCKWLTAWERASSRIGKQDEYRLPSDHEWSCAVGIGRLEDADDSPNAKSEKFEIYPWGRSWPPPKGAGNYGRSPDVDEFERTSPVGAFAANANGLFDMGGNVLQWCVDRFETDRVLRGSMFLRQQDNSLRSARLFGDPGGRWEYVGFRCVLVVVGK
jgi:formylglycine-generating enzyme required for sulfatase activity